MAELERPLMDSPCCRFSVILDDADHVKDSMDEDSYKLLALKLDVAQGHRLIAEIARPDGEPQQAEALGRLTRRVDIPEAARFHLIDFAWHCRHEVK